jgi:uncharacterized protein YjiS (DUF1127 family)
MLREAARAVQGWRRAHRAERDLLALDDRHLADIGISRSDIPNAARGKHREITNPICGRFPLLRR